MLRPSSFAVAACLCAAAITACGKKRESPRESAPPAPPADASGGATAAPVAPSAEAVPPPPPNADSGPTEHRGAVDVAVRLGGPQADAARAIAPLSDGGFAVTGYASGGFAVGGTAPAETHLKDIFVTRFDPAGKPTWTKTWGASDLDEGIALAVDSKDNIYVGGTFSGSVDFGTGAQASNGAFDLFVLKLDPAGAVQWLRAAGGRVEDKVYSIAVDREDDVLVTGYFGDEIDLGGGKVKARGTVDLFVAKYDGAGEHVWSRQFGGVFDDLGAAVASDYAGNVYVLGNFNETVQIDGVTLESRGNSDVLLLKLAKNGAYLWSRSFGSSFHDFGLGLAVDGQGQPLITGSFEETVDFGRGPFTGRGKKDMFLAKYDREGKPLWARHFGAGDNDIGSGLAVDAFGNAVLAGWFWKSVDFGKGALDSRGQSDMVIAKFDSAGKTLWSHSFGGDQPDFARGVAFLSDGRIAVAGTYRRDIALGEQSLGYEMEGQVPTGDGFAAILSP